MLRVVFLRFCSLSDSLIERLKDARINCSNDIDRRVEFLLGHACFPCVRKATFHSRIAQSHDCHSETE